MAKYQLLLLPLLLLFVFIAKAQDDLATCSATRACYQGCCSKQGNCGFGPDFCGSGCQGNCDAQAECGKYAQDGEHDCPINVCCSQYGYCGVTEEFCGDGCQNNSKGSGCGQPDRPGCGQDTDAMNYERRIGYYELFNIHERQCDKVYPEDLEVAPLTHINLAFVLFGDDFEMIDEDGDLISRVTFLKSRYQGLRVNVAVGGWAFNDPPTQKRFSDMASTVPNREKFINSLVAFITKYGLDGVDIDWEYPVANDRGGVTQDMTNYVLLMSDIREAFDAANPAWDATITVPTSYWYLRGFDLEGLQKHVSWINVMSYDLHGMWDQHNKYTGPYLEGHTNITEIEQGLDLLWRNGIQAHNVVMGFAFYGRSFTVEDTSCSKPGCRFSTSGKPGTCTNTGGILSYSEISSRNKSLSVNTIYDPKSTVKYNVYDGNQWISYDDEQSFTDKKKYLTSRCLGGLMIWAIDQDTQNHDALEGLLGDFSSSQLEGGSLDPKAAKALSSAFGAYTGQNCFVTPTCTDGTDGQKQQDQVCPTGTRSVSTAHNPLQAAKHDLYGTCDEGWFRYICCPEKAMPRNCEWNGAPMRSAFGCSGSCSSSQFLLNTDTFVDDKGQGECYTGTRDLCCDSTEALTKCHWGDCQGPIASLGPPTCGDDEELVTWRFDQDNGDFCSAIYQSPLGGPLGSPLTDRFKRAFCCPKGKAPGHCNWSNDPKTDSFPNGVVPYGDPVAFCQPQPCPEDQTKITEALDPPRSPLDTGNGFLQNTCDGFSIPAGFSKEFSFCCDPPSKYSDEWPVDPKYLFEHYYDAPEDDVMWSYDDEYRNNNADSTEAPAGAEDGSDAYGFVMLDGAPGSLDNEFPDSHTITTRNLEDTKRKRSILTSDRSKVNSTFDHVEETVYVYCNHPQVSRECRKVWYKGVEDTIIRLPQHIGEGPYARVVSMEPASASFKLPAHHIESRSSQGNRNPVYKLKFDYDFHLIKRDDVVNMRVDFTNLLGYWDEITDEPASKVKRQTYQHHVTKDEWHMNLMKAKRKHEQLRQRRGNPQSHAGSTDMSHVQGSMHKRWFGKFFDWLSRLNTVENKDVGFLSMAFKSSILLFKSMVGCPGQTFSANLNMYLDSEVEMEAVYAYYFSGTIVPPTVTGTYAYFSLEPSAYLGLRLTGNARLQATTGRKKLLDTISYPGLSIKGIAAVGPTLDLYGEIRGVVTLKGEMKAGAKLNFGKAEVHWPQDDVDANAKYEQLLGLEAKPKAQSDDLIAPTFDANVRADAQIDVLVTPEANLGLRVGGKISGGSPLVDAQLVGYVNTSLSFQAAASAQGGTNTGVGAAYRYGVYLFYNLGYGAYANVKFFPRWALQPRNAYNPSPRFTIYEKTGTFNGPAPSKRNVDPLSSLIPQPRHMRWRGIEYWKDTGKHTIVPTKHPGFDHALESLPLGNYSIDTSLSLHRRAGDSLPKTQNSDFSAPLTCPPGDSAQIRLPDYRLNGLVFQDEVLSGNGATQPVQGIYSGVRRFFLGRALANSDVVLTWDQDVFRREKRRSRVCGVSGGSYCRDRVDRLREALGNNRIQLSCDEFPFAGSEEGGDYYRTLSVNPTDPERTCVPEWQNTLQGNCNRILSELSTNVAYFERQQRGDNAANFAKWNNEAWYDAASSFNGKTPQRLALYPNQIPQAYGINDGDYNNGGNGGYKGYMFRKNFTFGVVLPSGHNDGGSWTPDGGSGAQRWTLAKTGEFPVGTDGEDRTAIACAVNTFGQNEIYNYEFNAYCYNGRSIASRGGFEREASFSKCIVEFATPSNDGISGSTTKKRSLGKFHEWNVLSIRILDTKK